MRDELLKTNKTTKKIYLSGPISGRESEVVERHFLMAGWHLAYELDKEGVTAKLISPDKLSAMDLSWDTYMQIARAIIEDPSVEGIHMLRGWEKSKGARLELGWAIARGMRVTYEAGALTL